ncbi:MAG: 7-carboxy-7-deazaguanine synthase QueE [Brevinematia bacterium]
MRISEIFESIQGEGDTIGRIALFIRTQGCPLDCIWCDTKYSIPFDKGYEKDTSEIVETIKTFVEKKNGIIIFTGGEPLYYQEEISKILSSLPYTHVEFETSGIYLPIEDLAKYKFNVSPKLSSSNLSGGSKIYQKIYSNLKIFSKLNSIFKFVISHKEELKEVEWILENYELPKNRVFLMPQGISIDEILSRSEFILPFCIDKGLNYSSRLQVLLKIK